MKTVIVAMIGISVVMLAVVIQGSVNMDSKYQHDLGVSLTRAMRQTMKQLEKDENGNERQQNRYMALLLQGMISRMDSDIELTVKVHRWDANKGELDVEAIGMYELPDRRNRTVAVRRKVIVRKISPLQGDGNCYHHMSYCCYRCCLAYAAFVI